MSLLEFSRLLAREAGGSKLVGRKLYVSPGRGGRLSGVAHAGPPTRPDPASSPLRPQVYWYSSLHSEQSRQCTWAPGPLPKIGVW